VTGEARYTAASRELIEDHGYAQNAMDPGVQAGPGSGGPRDDMTAFLCYYSLLRCSRDERLKAQIRASFSRYWVAKAPEMDPFFHFSYVAHLPPANRTQPRGGSPLRRWPDWFEDSLATLRGLPLDRLDWPHRNSHRLDLVPWGIEPSVDPLEARHSGRGSRVNGKVLPVENRHFNHWSADAWCLDASGDGGQLASGTVFLLPYYLGLYHRFIENPRDLGGDRASRGVP
jgi:hypothetical protein